MSKNIIDNFKRALEIGNEYFHKNNKEIDKLLMDYSWFITPNMDLSVVGEVSKIHKSYSKNKQEEIDKVFCDYFLKNNCKELEDMIINWRSNVIFSQRMEFFEDSLKLIKNEDKICVNVCNFVIPILISQIEGIKNIWFNNIKNIKYDNGKWILTSNGNKPIKEEEILEMIYKNIENSMYYEFYKYSFKFVLFNVLFQNTYLFADYSNDLHLSRHKILHGESIEYGKKEYLIRCFIILDILFEISQFIEVNDNFDGETTSFNKEFKLNIKIKKKLDYISNKLEIKHDIIINAALNNLLKNNEENIDKIIEKYEKEY
ncbi:hypothetical protein [uncultured Methanobrevibacter sp.]|uniref:hypothetical protein n=1 Tax=uncultured Methanobrevibacter sp. TaxID=253161 RepID=UPI00258F0FBB|nr:hypothetical protein [uncultured Methanobrevibacter sp.]